MNIYVQIREVISQSTSDYDKEKAQERLAKLSGGVAVLKVSFKGKLLMYSESVFLQKNFQS